MNDEKFIENAITYIRLYAYNNLNNNISITNFDVRLVWFGYILGNMKAIISTSLNDGKYYEVTYDRNKDKIYMDCYQKIDNKVVGE